MNILSVAKWDWAGCGYFLSEAINKHTDHHSRAVRAVDSTLGFPHDLQKLTGQRLKLLWDWADVIHIHDEPGFVIKKLPPKPTVITYHGTRYRKGYRSYHGRDRKRKWLGTVATPDLTRLGLPWLPDCRPDLMQYVDPADEFTVVHAPTKRKVKGTERVIEACKNVGVKLDLIEGVPWEECLTRKGRGHLVIDQFELGYGCNAIEAWAMGLPVIASGSLEVLGAMRDQFGSFASLPFLGPVDSVESAIEHLRDNDKAYGLWSRIGNDHYQKWHSEKAVAATAVKIYERALTHKQMEGASLKPTSMADQELVLLRYLGASAGRIHFFPDGSPAPTKYTFSAGESVRYVCGMDVEWFLDVKDGKGRPLFEVCDAYNI